MKKINLILSFILLNTIVFPAYAVDDGDTKFLIKQDVGIKTLNPSATLHLNGTGLFEDGLVTFSNTSPVTFNSLALVNNSLRIPTGASIGFVLTSDATGNASWTSLASLPSNGDNLGNHTATTALNMNNNDITNADDITANRYFGDGSNLTGVNASNGTINNTTINNPRVNNAFLQDPTINGTANFRTTSQILVNGGLRITSSPAAGRVLTSDASGNATWQIPANVADNLGNHTATTALNMNNNDITNADDITANRYFGDGSNLTGVNASNGTINNTTINNPRVNNAFLQDPTINGTANFRTTSQILVNGGLRITSSPVLGSVLTSDALGNATWQIPANVTDNLGNHTATQTLNMAANKIINAGIVNATTLNTTNLNSTSLIANSLRITSSPVLGSVLTSDALGNATWQIPANVADNLGNHTATQNLNMSTRNITNANIISANVFNGGIFRGDGSGLTGVSASNGTINNTTIRNSIFNSGIINNSVVNNSTINNSTLNNGYLQDPTINGVATFTANSIALFNGEVRIPRNSGAGKILISDRNGKAMWVFPAMVQTNGDNMGNHTASRDINMSSHDITNVGNITASSFNGGTFNGSFIGDGSRLKGVSSSVFKILANTILNNGSQASFANNFLIGSPSMDDSGNPVHDAKLFFNKAKGAFRVGTAEGNEWNNASIGPNSAAFGKNTRASGASSLAAGNGSVANNNSSISLGYNTTATAPYSVALGYNTLANESFSTAFGDSTEARGRKSTAFGSLTKATGDSATAFGKQTLASGIDSTAFGQEAQATRINSVAIGKNVRASGDQAFAIGSGNSNQDMLINSINNSLGIGFATNQPTLFVGPGAGGSTDGKVGIGTNTPQDLLDVDGRLRTKEFRMPTGAANDFVLTSDGIGVGTWKSLATIGGAGDNLGNHTATTTLNMANQDVTNVKNIEFNSSRSFNKFANVYANGSTLIIRAHPSRNEGNWLDSSARPPSTGNNGQSGSHTAMGYSALGSYNAVGLRNSAFGTWALGNLTSGSENTAFGAGVMSGMTQGSLNTAVGSSSLNIARGQANTAVGYMAGTAYLAPGSAVYNNNRNVYVGVYSGHRSNGNDNIFVGYGAGEDIINGSNNLIIRTRRGYKPELEGNLSNKLAIGDLIIGQDSANANADYLKVNGALEARKIKLTDGAAAGRVLTSDAVGNATWQVASGGGGGGADNLGNHTATLDLNMSNKNITNVANFSATGININSLRLPTGAGAGKVLTSDAAGNATWQTPSGGGGGGADNLGNHTATTALNMSNQNITNAGTINAVSFSGSGAGITNINAVNIATGVLDIARIPNIPSSKITSTGAGAGKVLTSDASGNATWQTPSGGGGSADNLGNHNATLRLNMANNNIVNGNILYSNKFAGRDGNTVSGVNAVAFGKNNQSTGNNSLSFGESNKALNPYSTAFGLSNETTGDYATVWGSMNKAGNNSTVWGSNNIVTGANATVWGSSNKVSSVGSNSTSWGNNNEAYGFDLTIFGSRNQSNADESITGGSDITVTNTALNSITFGKGISSSAGRPSTLRINNANSFNVGFNSTVPTFYVGPAAGTAGSIGKVGIGTTNPSNTLEVVGTAAKTGGGSWSNISDARLKDIHGKYEHGLKEILDLKTVRFSYKKDNARSLPSGTKEIGFIAQEVQKVIPEAVTEAKDGYLEFNIHPVNVAMVNAIQELKAEKDAEIKDLKDQVTLLKKLYCLDHANTELCK